jgi:hypothetical protein
MSAVEELVREIAVYHSHAEARADTQHAGPRAATPDQARKSGK